MATRVLSSRAVLLIEDNPGDVDLTRYCMEQAGLSVELHVAKDGHEARAFLDDVLAGPAARSPLLVLLDLNLPFKDGREVLREIREDHRTAKIPVVVFTSSRNPEDVRELYEAGANCYVSKPGDLGGYLASIRAIFGFWLGVARLPSG